MSQENTNFFKKNVHSVQASYSNLFPPLHQKMYCEIILFYAFNALKFKLFICSYDESTKYTITITIKCYTFTYKVVHRITFATFQYFGGTLPFSVLL